MIELESEFLSNDKTKPHMNDVITQLYTDLPTHGTTSIYINDANSLYLQMQPHFPPPPIVHPHQVGCVCKCGVFCVFVHAHVLFFLTHSIGCVCGQ